MASIDSGLANYVVTVECVRLGSNLGATGNNLALGSIIITLMIESLSSCLNPQFSGARILGLRTDLKC